MKSINKLPSVSLDCGACVWSEDVSATECCDWARIACESLKDNLSSNFAWFDSRMLSAVQRKKYFVDQLDNALINEKIEVHYQPIYDLKKNEIVGYEALSRWIDPDEGSFGPNRYVPILEQAHLIHKHDRYVLTRVLNEIKTIMDAGGKPLPVSINLSYYDFAFSSPGDAIPNIIEEYGVPKELIRFEVTERSFFNKSSTFVEGIQRLIDEGYEVWLDDYGGEYSSLSIILEIDFPVVKLDMSYIQLISDDPKKKHFIECVARIAKDVNTKILCEGIEDEEQVIFLKKQGIELGQGYYLGRPKSMQEMCEEW
jgi:EAL domain-containing protein (putative c-di-GMP-specific phosphodiesterase class I)